MNDLFSPSMSRKKSELILNPDGSVYHLHLKPENVAPLVLVVGDQERVKRISSFFDRVDFKVQNREFCTHTGVYNNKPVTVLSTGIGPDNIDIVLNELDAAVNIDLQSGEVKPDLTSLNIVRLGTSGSLRKDVPTGSLLVSEAVIGLDGLLSFYDVVGSDRENDLAEQYKRHMAWKSDLPGVYARFGSAELIDCIAKGNSKGITVTSPGFYAPQGRSLRLDTWDEAFHQKLQSFSFEGRYITNFEMETSALYGLGQALGHQTASVCAIIANRTTHEFLSDYSGVVDRMIEEMLQKLTA